MDGHIFTAGLSQGVLRGEISEGSGAHVLCKVRRNDGEYALQSDVTAISHSVFDVTSATPDSATSSGALTVSAVVFDSLQYDSRWPSNGYNFLHEISQTIVPTGGHTYRIEYVFDAASGPDWVIVAELDVVPMRGS